MSKKQVLSVIYHLHAYSKIYIFTGLVSGTTCIK